MSILASDEAQKGGLPYALRVFGLRAALALPLIALGDFLTRGPGGSSVLLLFAAMAIAVLSANEWRRDTRALILAGGILLLGALPLLEDFGTLTLAFGAFGLALFALLVTGQGTPSWWRRPADAALLWLSGPRRLFWDVMVVLESLAGTGWGRSIFGVRQIVGWIVPLGLLGVFALLFADANPVMLKGLLALDPAAWLPRLDIRQILIWVILLLLVWPFLHVRLMPAKTLGRVAPANAIPELRPPLPPPLPPVTDTPDKPAIPLADLLLSRDAILRSLVLFNLLFAAQTVMDAVYLWGGVALPDGMTYASYAHRGAYPLIATALLAAGFVLAAMRPNGPGQGDRLLRRLVYLFCAQNVALVLSSILRLDLYVGVYSLTYWRVAAFIWMGLVAIGLVLIAVRIALRQTNRWLIGANVVAALATLYCCCFVNFAALIANFNVDRFLDGTNRNLDLPYLVSLGPEAIPAIDRAFASPSLDEPMFYGRSAQQITRREWLFKNKGRQVREHERQMQDWRGWTYRGQRLSAYLAANPDPVPGALRARPAEIQLPPPLPAPVEPVIGDR